MAKAQSKPRTSTRKSARAGRKPKARGDLTAKSTSNAQRRPNTKHARIIAMLRAPAGATIAAMMTATKWQQHSVRGFLAGVVRKKLGLNLVSEKAVNGRVYHIKEGKGAPASDQAA